MVSNYRAITCLPIMWKLLTGIFAEETYDHLKDNNLLPDEQKGSGRDLEEQKTSFFLVPGHGMGQL